MGPETTAAEVVAGSGFSLVIMAEDGFGNVDPTYNSGVILAPANSPAVATLDGPITVPAVAGVATFAGLTLDNAATGYTLQASSGTLTGSRLSPSGGFIR